MIIGWVNDYKSLGGAETTNSYIIEQLEKQNNIVKFITPDEINLHCDFYIINNFRKFDLDRLNILVKDKPYIFFSHDIIPLKEEYEKFTYNLLKNSKLNIFLSPLHYRLMCKKYNLVMEAHLYIPMINFYGKTKSNILLKRNRIISNNTCWYGSIYIHKGIGNALLFARKNKIVIDFYGAGDPLLIEQIKQSKYGEYCGVASLDILTTYKQFVHIPNSIEAFGRSCAEAMIAGCDCYIDESKIGFSSWKFKSLEDFENRMGKSQSDLISKILNCL